MELWKLRWMDWMHQRDLQFAGALLVLAGVLLESLKLEAKWRCCAKGWFTLHLVCTGMAVLICAYAWWYNLRRLRLLRQTPTSAIASAAQGLVELSGEGDYLDGVPVLSPLSSEACLWYRFEERTRSGSDWEVVASGESSSSFVLTDQSGSCVIEPTHAEIFTQHHADWMDGERWMHEWLLLSGDALRVIGHFQTRSPSTEPRDVGRDLNALLREWKQDMPGLLARFDLNGDGAINKVEWQLVRADATRAVKRRHTALLQQGDTHTVSAVPHACFYMIGNQSRARLSLHFLVRACVYLSVFFCALFGFALTLILGVY